MMRQYQEIKKQYTDCLLFYRMGDFYELFMEDALLGSQILNITLTAKQGGKDGKIPMAGVPYHAVDSYIAKLVKAGYKVAICEQLSPPNKKGIVKRDVVRVVTPGTLLDESALNKKENNFIVTLSIENDHFALAAADLSTGFFTVIEGEYDPTGKQLSNELARLKPSECILPDDLYNQPELLKIIRTEKEINIYPYLNCITDEKVAKKLLKHHFSLSTLSAFSISDKPLALTTAASLLMYLKDTQKTALSHIKKISSSTSADGMLLDRSSMINLELFSTIREHETKGTLLSVLDQTVTAMGGRLLKSWMKKPLIKKEAIEERLESVSLYNSNPELRDDIRKNLTHLPDIERLLSRLAVGLGNARDLTHLRLSLEHILQIKQLILALSASSVGNKTLLTADIEKQFPEEIEKLIEKISFYIVDEPPVTTKDGKMIKSNVNTQLDTLRSTIGKSKEWIVEMEKNERERTKIHSLKMRFNKVFGFYIEISNANLHLIPSNYMRKQTLVNGERFITKELKEHEEIILTAEEKIFELEYQLFQEVLEYVLSHTQIIQTAAEHIAVIDCLADFSYLAEKNHYVKPKLLYSGEIKIKDGRHPVVEKLLEDTQFVPNDVSLDNISQSLLLITGPNMAGKSVFLRSTALIVLMAQMGCFVPATSAHISIVDRIFVRSGASDVITSGLSTFMVEMVETAYILNNTTENSLIIMDEIGRGTSTYDGISIAWAVVDYLATHFTKSPKVLFATHYHELQALENQFPMKIRNFHMGVSDQKGSPVFLHTILPGGASHSFGVAVAKLAGVPEEVVLKAYEVLQSLEYREVTEKGKEYPIESSAKEDRVFHQDTFTDHVLAKELEHIDVATMTPLEALNTLAKLKEKLKLVTQSDYSNVD